MREFTAAVFEIISVDDFEQHELGCQVLRPEDSQRLEESQRQEEGGRQSPSPQARE